MQLQDAGKLPGFPAGAEGEIHIESGTTFERVTYPYTKNIFVFRGDNPSIYTYHFVKASKDSKWQLTHAWVTTQNGERSELQIQ